MSNIPCIIAWVRKWLGPDENNSFKTTKEEVIQTERQITFLGLTIKTIVVHTVTYFIMGLLALALLDYKTAFEGPVTREYMRSVDDPLIALGLGLQFIRGILFAMASTFYGMPFLGARMAGWSCG
jgi:hypothetical protein